MNFQDLWNKFFIFIFGQLCDKITSAFVVMGIGKKKACVGWRWDGQRSLGRQCPFCWCLCVCGEEGGLGLALSGIRYCYFTIISTIV